MANGKLSRAHVGLALTSALIVLLASGVAISRISDGDVESPVATGPSSTSSSVPGLGQAGGATGSGPAGSVGIGGVASPAPPSTAAEAAEAVSGATTLDHGVTRTARKAAGSPGASSSGSSAAATTGSAGSGAAAGSDASNGGSQGGGGDSPPAPSQVPPDKTPLATAAVSAGEGSQGAVVGIGFLNDKPAEADVTVGTNPLVGDHPPSEGTGIAFGGRFFNPPPSLPAPPG